MATFTACAPVWEETIVVHSALVDTRSSGSSSSMAGSPCPAQLNPSKCCATLTGCVAVMHSGVVTPFNSIDWPAFNAVGAPPSTVTCVPFCAATMRMVQVPTLWACTVWNRVPHWSTGTICS